MDDETAVALTRAIREHSGLELASIRDAGTHGADGRFGGFTYYNETSAFVQANRSLVYQLLRDDAEEFGYDSVPAFVASFNRADMAGDLPGYDCLLAWYALEACGRYWNDRKETRC